MKLKMNTYQKIEKTLLQALNDIRQYDIQCEKIENEYQSRLQQGEQVLQTGLNQIMECQNIVNTYLRIAKAHTRYDFNPQTSQPYNKEILARLSVQINMNSHEDMSAKKLLETASCQLLGLNQSVQQAHRNYNQIKNNLEKEMKRNKAVIYQKKSRVKEQIQLYVQSAEFNSFLRDITTEHKYYEHTEAQSDNILSGDGLISVGSLHFGLTLSEIIDDHTIATKFSGIYNKNLKTLLLPLYFDFKDERVYYLEYDNNSEQNILSGIQMLILNTARYLDKLCDHICFIDPVRMNGSALGCLQPLTQGVNSYIDEVPVDKQGIMNILSKSIAVLNNASRDETGRQEADIYFRRIFIFHDFPQGYTSEAIDIIRRLCANAKNYGIKIIVLHNVVNKEMQNRDLLDSVQAVANGMIFCNNNQFYIYIDGITHSFNWYQEPKFLLEEIKQRYVVERSGKIMSNDYGYRVGLKEAHQYKKGNRMLSNIPIGVDQNGNVISIDLENSNFATFICGASRSGKSTLLHTIITDVIKNKHPDDVEIWLVDFKMTEFSRYINHLPPHVRYIILDESPELVYDLIDRLSEILQKRQDLFRGKWQKLSDVPTEKYMPAILVIIDEFSIMSGIIRDSINGSIDYRGKMQALLAKGAALGFHFIFASQGFTSGTSGLTDFTKRQIQQRIAMKTEFAEIKATLDLQDMSDEDHFQMEQLPVHHALLRIPVDDKGNRLQFVKVLYISDYEEQETLIDTMVKNVSVMPKYDLQDLHVYIYKRPMIFNGNEYAAFSSKQQIMQDKYSNYRSEYDEGTLLFIGEPRRMLPIFSVEVMDSFGENIMLIAPPLEKMPAVSILLSIIESLKMQDKDAVVWATKRNALYRQMNQGCRITESVFCDIEQVCHQIAVLKKDIEEKRNMEHFYVLLGFESLITDMAYLPKIKTNEKKEHKLFVGENHPWGTSDQKEQKGPDIYQLIEDAKKRRGSQSEEIALQKKEVAWSLEKEMQIALDVKQESIENVSTDLEQDLYDAREDLKFILTHGPKQGAHFLMVFNTVGEIERSKIDMSLFRHKILFRTAKGEAASLVGSAIAETVSNLDNHCYRYSNGLEAVSFRPYLHQNLTWDGWSLDADGKAVLERAEEEDYLM